MATVAVVMAAETTAATMVAVVTADCGGCGAAYEAAAATVVVGGRWRSPTQLGPPHDDLRWATRCTSQPGRGVHHEVISDPNTIAFSIRIRTPAHLCGPTGWRGAFLSWRRVPAWRDATKL
eukprot:63-Prymnesium_polylepis.1